MPSPPSPFASTYAQARELFARTAQAAGGHLTAISHPLPGPTGESLAIDLALLGPDDAHTVVVCLSGVHGAEGFAGSGAQVAWLQHHAGGSLPDGVSMLFVHGVNPWGFAHGLRGTEDNIDINRNWLDHTQPHPQNPLYAEIHPHLCPPDMSRASVEKMLLAGGRFVERHGQWALEDAISRGQYTHPDGYHFGGTSLAWSTRELQKVVRERLATARRVAYVDFHSGPVGNGETIFLCFSDEESVSRTRAAQWWGEDALAAQTVEKQWGSQRPTRSGIVFWGLEKMLEGQADVAGAVVEFCSARARSEARYIMRIPMLERWLRFVGGLDAPEAPGYLMEIRDTYAPRRADWERRVAAGAIDVLDKTLAGAAAWARES